MILLDACTVFVGLFRAFKGTFIFPMFRESWSTKRVHVGRWDAKAQVLMARGPPLQAPHPYSPKLATTQIKHKDFCVDEFDRAVEVLHSLGRSYQQLPSM